MLIRRLETSLLCQQWVCVCQKERHDSLCVCVFQGGGAKRLDSAGPTEKRIIICMAVGKPHLPYWNSMKSQPLCCNNLTFSIIPTHTHKHTHADKQGRLMISPTEAANIQLKKLAAEHTHTHTQRDTRGDILSSCCDACSL